MTSTELTKILIKLSEEYGKRIFRLKELSALTRESASSAGMALIRARKAQLVERVGNLWFNMLEPPLLEEIAFELRPVSYISFESALYRHGVLSQSPRGYLTLATTGRPANIKTPLGDISFIHVKKSLFFGFDEKRLALPEKAFLDMIYIRMKKGTFKEMTEVLYPDVLNKPLLKRLSRRFPGYVIKKLPSV